MYMCVHVYQISAYIIRYDVQYGTVPYVYMVRTVFVHLTYHAGQPCRKNCNVRSNTWRTKNLHAAHT